MKKTLVLASLLAAFGAASAQSNVTLFGTINAGVGYSSNQAPGANKLAFQNADNNKLGVMGSESLGGGLTATFAVQMRFNPATGTQEQGTAGPTASTTCGAAPLTSANCGGAKDLNGNYLSAGVQNVNFGRPLFQGETRVGIQGGFGHVRFGRGLTALQAPNGGMIDPWGVTTVAGSVYAAGFATDYTAGGEGRIDNGFFYNSPSIAGFSVAASYSPRKVKVGGASSTDVFLTHVATPTVNAVGFSKTHSSIAATYSAGPANFVIGTEKNRFGDSLTNVGGNYNLGFAKLYAGYGSVKGGTAAERDNVAFTAVAAGSPGGGTTPVAAGGKVNSLSIGAVVPFGATKIVMGYSRFDAGAGTFVDQTGINGVVGATAKNDKLGLGVNYALSPRTSIYSNVASTTRKQNTANVDASKSNSKVTAFDFGLAHNF